MKMTKKISSVVLSSIMALSVVSGCCLSSTTHSKNEFAAYAVSGAQLSAIESAVTNWANTLLNQPSYGSSKAYSSNWYSDLSDVELVARLIVGESGYTEQIYDRKATAWVLVNRKNGPKWGNTYKEVATQSGQFTSIVGNSSETARARNPKTSQNASNGKTPWEHATWLACLLLYTSDSSVYNQLMSKPSGIDEQCFMLSSSYFLSQCRMNNGQLQIKIGSNWQSAITPYINGYGKVSSKSDLETLKANNFELFNQRNIFFNIPNP